MKYRDFRVRVPVPEMHLFRALRRTPRWLLPSPGNMLFTILVIAGLLWANSAGALTLNAPAASAPSTSTIPYQGRLADSAGNPVTATTPMVFRLYSAGSGGTPLWEENWTGSNSVQVSDGLFNVMLGSLTPIAQATVTGNSNLWLGITVGADNEMVPRVQLGSVPWAMQALTVPDGAIGTAKIADGAVTSRKMKPTYGDGVMSPCCLTLSETRQEIPGSKKTVVVDVPSVMLVTATFDFVPVVGTTTTGNVMINGSPYGRQSQLYAANGVIRGTVATSVIVPLEPGTHTIALAAQSDGASQALHHTGYTYVLFAR